MCLQMLKRQSAEFSSTMPRATGTWLCLASGDEVRVMASAVMLLIVSCIVGAARVHMEAANCPQTLDLM